MLKIVNKDVYLGTCFESSLQDKFKLKNVSLTPNVLLKVDAAIRKTRV